MVGAEHSLLHGQQRGELVACRGRIACFAGPAGKVAADAQGVAEWIFALSDGLAGYSSADYDRVALLRW